MKHDVIFSGATTPRIRVGRVMGRLCLWNLVWVILTAVPPSHAMTLHAVFDGWFGSSSHVLDDGGMLWSWGANAGGQLADGTKNAAVNARKLALPHGVSRWVQFRGGAAFTMLDDQGRLFGWGPTESVGGVDYQLGGFPGGELFTYPPVIPGGEAPFLLGRPADVPRLQLGYSGSLIVEPVSSGAADTGSQTLYMNREGREELPVFATFDVRIRRLDGSWIPEPEASAVLREICPIWQRVMMLGSQETQAALVMTPRRALDRDEDLWIDVELLPHPNLCKCIGDLG